MTLAPYLPHHLFSIPGLVNFTYIDMMALDIPVRRKDGLLRPRYFLEGPLGRMARLSRI